MAEGRVRTIVVIEDEAEVRKVVEGMLGEAGYRVLTTGDPAQGIELVRTEKPDLVISDITMPNMDGYAVLRALQADSETAACPVVFLSGQRDFSERVRAFRFGVVDYVTKPFTREILVKKVDRVLEGRSRRPGTVADMPAPALLEQVQREARTGVLTVHGDAGEERIVLRAGQVVDGQTTALAADPSARAAFEELDADTSDIVVHDPFSLSTSRGRLPSFDEFPPLVRDVLIVDDNAVFRRFLRDLLSSCGFTVREASNGKEALEIALEDRPWLILTDVRMPGGDGFEFCRHVRSHSLIRQTPLLFLSGWDDYKQRYQGLRLGADDFLSKESSIRELLVRIQLLMKRYSDLGARESAGMQGEIEVIGAPGVLQVCHLSRLSGVLSAQQGPWRASVRFREGEIVGAECGPARAEDAIFEFLGWESGTFQFVPADPGEGERLGESFERLVLEGCRRLDEARREQFGGD